MAQMNIALQHMFRKRRQHEGRRPPEPYYPPGSEDWFSDLPPGFAYTVPPTVEQRENRTLPPAYDYTALQELPTAHQNLAESLDASNPPDSNFYAAGQKIRPWAHIRVPAYLAISEIESVADDEFKTGKLAALGLVVPQQVGGQASIDISPLIPEAQYTTYGALTTLMPGQVAEDGYLYG